MFNVKMDKIQESIQKAQTDPAAVQVQMNLEGSWRMDELQPQFGGKVKLPSGEEVLFESDFPPFLGGKGMRPSPLQYCFWGGMACFASTFMLVAVAEKVEIKNFTIKTTGLIDFHQALGISNADPIHGLTWEVHVETDVSQQELDRLNHLAEERCPASWMLKHIVPFTAKVVKTLK